MSRQIPDGVYYSRSIDFELKLFRWPDHSPKGRCPIAVPKIESRTSTVKRIGSIIEIIGGRKWSEILFVIGESCSYARTMRA